MVLTPEQKKYYIEHRGRRCPVCHTYEISAKPDSEGFEGGIAEDVSCDECGAQWTDIYTLTGVE